MTDTNIKVISAAAAMFSVCIATKIVSISVTVAYLLVLLVLGTVSTSGLHIGHIGGSGSGVPKNIAAAAEITLISFSIAK